MDHPDETGAGNREVEWVDWVRSFFVDSTEP